MNKLKENIAIWAIRIYVIICAVASVATIFYLLQLIIDGVINPMIKF